MPTPVTKATRLAALYSEVAKVHSPFVKPAKQMSSGDPNSKLLVVFGHALTDLLGQEKAYLNEAFKTVELDKRTVFFAYAIKGSLMREHNGGMLIEHREARTEELDTYRHFLLDEINIVRPSVVLCMGGTAIKTLLGDPHFSVTKMAGAELDIPGISCPAMATVSFSYVVKTGGKRSKAHSQFIGDLRHAKALSENSEV